MTLFTVFFQMLALLIMMGSGVFLTKQKILDAPTSAKLSKMILVLFNPMLSLANALKAAGQVPLSRLGLIALISVGMHVIFLTVGGLLAPFFDKDPFQKRMYELMMGFPNVGFIGIPVVSTVVGSEYVIYVTEFMIIYNVVFYTYGMALMDGKFSLSALKAMVTPANGMILASLVIVVADIHLPDFLETAITYLGNVASPMSLVTVGFTLANANLRRIFGNLPLYVFSLVKLLLLPLALLPVLRLLPLEPELVAVCVILLGMPVGNMPLILGTERGLDCNNCSAGIIMTTLLCVVTVPILMVFV